MSTSYLWEMTPEERLRKLRREAQSSTATQSQSDFQLSDKHKQELLDIVEGRDTFSYDAQSDPMYQQYREQYTRNARGAAEDVYANATARSGGFGNSYANVAAQQTYNTQMEGVTDIIPELEALAYGRHQTQQEQKLTAYDQLQALYDADHEELLSRMYLYAYNGTQEGLWDGASGAEEALRAKFPEMTDDDFATIKAEMYDGGYWSGAEKSGAPSGGYTAEDGTVVSQEEVDEAYNFLLGLMKGGVDENGNEIAGVDVMKQQSYVAQLAEDSGISEGALQGAYAKLDKYEQADVEDTQRNNQTLIEKAMAGISDKYYDPTALGIDAEEWAGMSDEEREGEVMMIAEGMAARGELKQSWYFNQYYLYVEDKTDGDHVSASDIEGVFENLDEQDDKAVTQKQKLWIKKKIAKKLKENGTFDRWEEERTKMMAQNASTGGAYAVPKSSLVLELERLAEEA